MSQNKERLVTAQEAQVLVQDPLCEKKVLGTILNFGEVYDQVAEILDDGCFRDGRCLGVWQAMVEVRKNGTNIDIITVTAELAKEGSTIQPWEVVDISQNGGFTTEIETYVYRLKDLSLRRRLWRLGQKLVMAGVAETDDIADVQQLATEELTGLFDKTKGVIKLTEALNVVLDIVNKNMTQGHITGSYTGFRRLDEKGGLHGSDLIIIAGETSNGKALPMDANILTPTGWKKNKDIKVGDEVCSIDGAKSYVIGVFPQGVKPMYKIIFSDGREITCCKDHLWEVDSSAFKSGNRVLTTEQIKDMQDNHVAFHNRMGVPSFSGIWGTHKRFIIHPYLLGVLLGDGCLTRGVIWNKPDDFILYKISSFITPGMEIHKIKNPVYKSPSYAIVTPKGRPNPYLEELQKLGLRGLVSEQKFIPEEYLDSDREQRLLLLQGLMDTDGYVDKQGQCVFCSKSSKLADGVRYLAHSLGYKATMFKKRAVFNGKSYGYSYNVTINDNNESRLFSLPRKAVRMITKKRIRNVIRSVEYIGDMEAQCIAVSHPRQLYVTDGFIMTHNTSLALSIVKNAAEKCEDIAVYSLEMTDVQLTSRLLSMKSGVPGSDIMYSNQLNPAQLEMLDTAKGLLPGEHIYFDDDSTSSLEKILLSIRNMKLKYDIKGAVVDYLQILNVNQKNSSYTREQAMGDAARRLKNLAKELNIWIIALSQLSRNQQDPVPTMARLRDSGQIAEAADVVMLVYRPEIYNRTFPQPFDNRTEEECHGLAMIDVAKGRNIGIFKFLVEFNASTTHFVDMDLEEPVYEGPVEEDAPF